MILDTPTLVKPEAMAKFRSAAAYLAEMTRPARETSEVVAKMLEGAQARPVPVAADRLLHAYDIIDLPTGSILKEDLSY